ITPTMESLRRYTTAKSPLPKSPEDICSLFEQYMAQGDIDGVLSLYDVEAVLRLLSAGESTFKYDLGSEDREGHQDSTISVFTRDSDGTVRHFYSGHPWLAADVKERGIDELTPIWNVLDLTPQG